MAQVDVSGIDALRRALKAAGEGAEKELAKAHKTVAGDIVADAKARARSLGGVAAKSAGAVKASGTQRRAAVTLSASSRYPFALGAEFGSKQYRQFRAWRGAGPGSGYFLWPAADEGLERAAELYLEVVGDLIERRL